MTLNEGYMGKTKQNKLRAEQKDPLKNIFLSGLLHSSILRDACLWGRRVDPSLQLTCRLASLTLALLQLQYIWRLAQVNLGVEILISIAQLGSLWSEVRVEKPTYVATCFPLCPGVQHRMWVERWAWVFVWATVWICMYEWERWGLAYA